MEAARVGHRDWTGKVYAIELEVERTTATRRRYTELRTVRPRVGNIGGIIQPLTGGGESQIQKANGIGRMFKIHRITRSGVRRALVRGCRVVKRNRGSTHVIVFKFDTAEN